MWTVRVEMDGFASVMEVFATPPGLKGPAIAGTP